jgi:hypothetical protein
MLSIDNVEMSVIGRFLRTAKLRHEWCDFLDDPMATVKKLRDLPMADLLTFVPELFEEKHDYPFHIEKIGVSVLAIKSYEQWWDDLGFKARNKVRKAQKSGLDVRLIDLNPEFAKGVAQIYSESPVRQGRKFFHYGKTEAAVMEELSSFLDRTYFIASYDAGELVGFMKLFHGKNVLRTIHFISKLSHRQKPVMDGLIDKAVWLCDQKKVPYLQYGSWTEGGIGVFREKHGFVRVETSRYFAPLTRRGELMLKLNLQRPLRDRLPKGWTEQLKRVRKVWTSLRGRLLSELAGNA